MTGVDQSWVNKVIYEASKDSLYFKNEQKKDQKVQERVVCSMFTPLLLSRQTREPTVLQRVSPVNHPTSVLADRARDPHSRTLPEPFRIPAPPPFL